MGDDLDFSAALRDGISPILESMGATATAFGERLAAAASEGSGAFTSLRAVADSALGSVGTNASEMASGVAQNVSRMDNALDEGASVAKRMGSAIGEGMRNARTHVSNFVGGLLDFGSKIGMAAFGAQAFGQTAMSLGQALIGPNATLEQQTIAFTGLLHSGEKARAFLGELQQFAASTPFEFPDLVEASQHMLAFGFSADEVKPYLTAVGDAAAGLGAGADQVNAMVYAMGQMHAAGTVHTQDLMQLANTGVPVYQILADGLHKNVAQVKDMVEHGKLLANDALPLLQQGMEKTFGGQMANQATTFNGLLSTFQDNARMALTSFAGPLFDKAKGSLEHLGNLVSSKSFQDFAKTIGSDLANGLSTVSGILQNVVPFIGGIAQTFATNLKPGVEAVEGAFKKWGEQLSKIDWNSLKQTFGDIADKVGALAGMIAQGLGNALKSIDWTQVAAVLGDVATAFGKVLGGVIDFVNFIKDHQAILGGIAITIGVIGTAILVSLIPAFISWAITAGAAAIANALLFAPIILIVGAILALGIAIAYVITHWKDITKAIGDFLANAGKAIGEFFSNLGKWFQARFAEIGDKLHQFVEGIKNAIHAGFQWIQDRIHDAINFVVNLFSWLYNHNYYFKALVDAIKTDIELGKRIITTVFNAIRDFLTGVWKFIKQTAENEWAAIQKFIVEPIQHAAKWVQDKFNELKGWLKGLWDTIVADAKALWAKIQDAFSAGVTAAKNFIDDNYIKPLMKLFDLGSKAFEWGKNLLKMFADGLGSMKDYLWQAATNALGGLAKVLGFHSPAEEGPGADADTWAPNLVRMFAQGLSDGEADVSEAAKTVARALHDNLNAAGDNSADSDLASGVLPVSALAGYAGGAGSGGGKFEITVNLNGSLQQGLYLLDAQVRRDLVRELAEEMMSVMGLQGPLPYRYSGAK